MRLGGISYWQPKELTLQDSSQPVNVAKAQANLLQAQAGNAQAQASLAGQESNTARAWGKVYETAGNLPNEFAKGIEKYSAARADATITAKMSDFSTQYNDPSKMFFTPEELDADGIKYNPTEQGADGKSVLRQQIPKLDNKYQSMKFMEKLMRSMPMMPKQKQSLNTACLDIRLSGTIKPIQQ